MTRNFIFALIFQLVLYSSGEGEDTDMWSGTPPAEYSVVIKNTPPLGAIHVVRRWCVARAARHCEITCASTAANVDRQRGTQGGLNAERSS